MLSSLKNSRIICHISSLFFIFVLSPYVVLTYISICLGLTLRILIVTFAAIFFFPKCLLIHQFNLLHICVFSSEYCKFGWLCITSKIFEGNYLLCCVSFSNNFLPRQFCHYFNCRSFCSFFISSSHMCPACYSDGFFLKEFGLWFSQEGLLLCCYKHTRKAQILVAYDFCYHSAFQQVGFFFFWVVFLHAVARAQTIQFSSPVCFPRYCYINNTIVLLWAAGGMIWRQWYRRYDVTCTFLSRSIVSSHTGISHTEPHCIASFICPPWIVTDLAVAFWCVN